MNHWAKCVCPDCRPESRGHSVGSRNLDSTVVKWEALYPEQRTNKVIRSCELHVTIWLKCKCYSASHVQHSMDFQYPPLLRVRDAHQLSPFCQWFKGWLQVCIKYIFPCYTTKNAHVLLLSRVAFWVNPADSLESSMPLRPQRTYSMLIPLRCQSCQSIRQTDRCSYLKVFTVFDTLDTMGNSKAVYGGVTRNMCVLNTITLHCIVFSITCRIRHSV